MIQDILQLQQRHEEFIKKICKTEKVYGLENQVGFATLDSANYEDENGKSMPVMCFWSNRNGARACAKDKWKSYEPSEIQLAEFIEEWCVGMYNEGLLAELILTRTSWATKSMHWNCCWKSLQNCNHRTKNYNSRSLKIFPIWKSKSEKF